MLGRSFSLNLVLAVLLALAAGCKKSEPEQKPAGQAAQTPSQPFTNAAPGELLARIHWLGKKRLAGDINAAPFMGIWNMPESEKLEKQTLDKLALAPWDLPRAGTNLPAIVATNAGSALLRPLLDDLVQEESYLEIRSASDGGASVPANRSALTVLAIHLDDQRAAQWRTNIAALLPSLATNHYSQLTNPSLTRAGQWTILTFGDAQNPLAQHIAARIQHSGAPVEASLTNYWIEAQLDLKQMIDADRISATGDTNAITWPTNVEMTVTGDGKNVITRGEFDFAQALPIELEPWNVPTNLIHDPLIGFSAIRGFRPLLKAFKPWNDLQLGAPPNQAYTFAQHGAPWMHFAIVPSAAASNQVDRLADYVVNNLNPKITTSRLGSFEKVPATQHLKWNGVVFSPDLNWTNIDNNSYILAGFSTRYLTNRPTPPELFLQFNYSTNIIWYDWEFSHEILKGWTPIYQLVRHMFDLPRFDADDIAWLMNTARHLGNCVSALRLESLTRVSFTRESTIGLTGIELPIFVDWLQSPKFPRGLHTFLAPPPPPSVPPRPNTNASPATLTNSPTLPKKP